MSKPPNGIIKCSKRASVMDFITTIRSSSINHPHDCESKGRRGTYNPSFSLLSCCILLLDGATSCLQNLAT